MLWATANVTGSAGLNQAKHHGVALKGRRKVITTGDVLQYNNDTFLHT